MTSTTPTHYARFYALDALRVTAMLLGIVLHLSLIYVHMPTLFWKLKDSYQNYVFDALFIVIHLFRMELFFIISGFFTYHLYHKKGLGHFIKNRFTRIFIPFLIGWPVVMVLFTLSQPMPNLNEVIASLSTVNMQTLQTPPVPLSSLSLKHFSPFHLWFLYYLLIFYIFFMACNCIHKMLKWLPFNFHFLDNFFQKALVRRPRSPYAIFLLALILLPLLLLMNTFWVDIPFTFLPILRLLFYYGLFFSAGIVLRRHLLLLDFITSHRKSYLKISLPLTLVLMLFVILGFHTSLKTLPFWAILFIRLGYALCTLSLVLSFIGYAHAYFNTENRWVRYLADAAYWMYLMHLPLLAYFQGKIGPLNLPGFLKPFLLLGATVITLLLTYHFWVRYSKIGLILNGVVPPPRTRFMPLLRQFFFSAFSKHPS